jgi:uncharacterized membrane protein (UPF0136 family)
MNWLSASLVLYGLLNIVLGLLAYSKSPVSLYAGGGAGLVAIIAALIAKSNPKVGYVLGALVCIALLGRFLPKILKEFQLYPGFVIVAASAVMLVLLIVGHFAARR